MHRLAEAVVEMSLMTEAEARKIIDPMLMTDPARMAAAIHAFRAGKAAKA